MRRRSPAPPAKPKGVKDVSTNNEPSSSMAATADPKAEAPVKGKAKP